MKLYDFIDLLNDDYIVIISNNGNAHKINKYEVREYYNNDKILSISTDLTPSRETLIFIKIAGKGGY